MNKNEEDKTSKKSAKNDFVKIKVICLDSDSDDNGTTTSAHVYIFFTLQYKSQNTKECKDCTIL